MRFGIAGPFGTARARRAAAGVAAAALLAAAVTAFEPAQAAPAPAVPVLHWIPCGAPFECATAQVPLDYARPRGATIGIALIKLPASDPAHRIGSLFVNPGGPGGSGVDFVRGAATAFWSPQVRARFDIVGFDPRGVARSAPIRCFKSIAQEYRLVGSLPAFPVGRQQTVRYISSFEKFDAICLQRSTAIMQHMATADAARDLDLLRQAVGDAQLTYDGVSYGSYLGDTYANMFPAHVRALIIDGVLNPVQWATGHRDGFTVPFSTRLNSAHGAYDTLLQFFKFCKASGPGKCAFAGGHPFTKYYTLLARARKAPITANGQAFTFADIVNITLGALYNFGPADFPNLAKLLQALYTHSAAGSAAAAQLIAGLRGSRPAPAYYNGLESFFGVACSDTDNPHYPFAWPREAAEQDEQSPYFGSDWTWVSEPCATWPARDADRYTGPFTRRTSHPVLVIGNLHDPATPYAGAQAAAGMLPNSRLLTLNGWGHTSLGRSACVDRYITGYLVNLTLPPAGTVCQSNQRPFGAPAAVESSRAAAALAELLPAPLVRALPSW